MADMIRRIVTIVLPVVLLSACASNVPAPRLARGESINVMPPEVQRIDVTVDSKAKRAGRGAALGVVGVVGGAVVGALGGAIYGLGCGPLAIVCSPMFAAAGASVLGIGGGVAGTVYGATGGISGDKADRFNEVAAAAIDKSGLQRQLNNLFVVEAGKYWSVDGGSSNTVTIYLKSLRFKQTAGEHIQLVVQAEMEVRFASMTRKLPFEYSGEVLFVDDWLANDGQNLRLEVATATQTLTREMVQAIRFSVTDLAGIAT